MRKYIVCIFLLLAIIGTGFSQNNIVTIEECQQWAVSQSSANVQKELNDKLLKVKLNNAAAHLYPKLEINGEAAYHSEVPQLYPYVSGADTFSRFRCFIRTALRETGQRGGNL